MLQAYIRVSAVMTKWMFSSIFYIVAPFINKFLFLMSRLGFLSSFIWLIVAVQTHQWRIFWVVIGASVISMALLLLLESVEFMVEMNQIGIMMQSYEGSLMVRIRNTIFGFAWFVALSIASFYAFHLMNELEAGAFGFLFFIGFGNLIGLGLVMKNGGERFSEMVSDFIYRVKASLTFKRKPAPAEIGNVVQMRFTKRG